MGRIFYGHSHPRPCSGKKTLRRCRDNEEADHVILIDGDSENLDNVIIIDVPESLPKETQGASMLSKDKKWSFGNVIYIDDDDTPDSNHSIGVDNVDCSAGTSSKREPHHAAKNFAADSADAAVDECHFVQDNATPVRLSKCKRTYSGKAFTRNRYGLNTNSQSDSSDNDYPDCELVEDSSGEVQEQWERAFSRRRKDIPVGRSDTGGHHSTSRVNDKNHHQNIEMEDATRQHKEASCCFSTRKFTSSSDAPSLSRTKDNDFGCSCPFYVEPMEEHPASSNSAFKEQSTKEFNHPAPACDEGETPKVERCPPNFESCVDEDSSDGKSAPLEDEVTICKSRSSFETNFQEAGTGSVKGREHLESRKPHSTGRVKEMENLMPEKCPIKSSTLPDKLTNDSSTRSGGAVGSSSRKSLFSEHILGSDNYIGQCYFPENMQPASRNIDFNQPKPWNDISVPIILQEEDIDGELHSQNEDFPSVGTCIINEREKLKETDEYKRAIEEEWAARQQALLIQVRSFLFPSPF